MADTASSNISIFLGLDGIPTRKLPLKGVPFFQFDPSGTWRISSGDKSFDIEAACIKLHDALAAKIFGNLQNYHRILPRVPEWVFTAGLNSESAVSKVEFERFYTGASSEVLHKLLYFYDCRKLVTSIQEATIEIVHLQGEFFKTLNLEELFYPQGVSPDGLRMISSPVTTKLIALINVIFIRLHSLLDYMTKLIYEVEHIRTDFTEYPRLSARSKLFGDRRDISLNLEEGTLFQPCFMITEIETFRNLIIHDGFLDDMPKAYELRSEGNVKERFILMPDRIDGRLTVFKNRKLFYGAEDKINLRLPTLVSEFQNRLEATLLRTLDIF